MTDIVSFEDQTRETSTGTGTGNLTLNGAYPGFTTFFEAFSTTKKFEYLIKSEGVDGVSLGYEVGVGQMLDASTMQRISVRSSTNGDTFVNFDGGTKEVIGWLSGPKTNEFANVRTGLFDAGDKTGASQNIDWTSGNNQKCRLTGNVTSSTFTAPEFVSNGLVLEMHQDTTGSRTFVWPASVKWDRNVTPVLSTVASSIDRFFFFWNGTEYASSFWKPTV